uniref:Uncharacterized protein n=1 Tax=Arundo donax TaxID=35708 RepID=A0A0A9AI08_ARUDO
MTPGPPSVLGLQTIFHAARGGFLGLISELLQRQCFIYLSICLITVAGNLSVYM